MDQPQTASWFSNRAFPSLAQALHQSGPWCSSVVRGKGLQAADYNGIGSYPPASITSATGKEIQASLIVLLCELQV